MSPRPAPRASTRLVTVGTDADPVRGGRIDVARGHDGVWATVGLHPHDADAGRRRRSIEVLADPDPEVVAVGECGLDYYYEHSPPAGPAGGVRRPGRPGQDRTTWPW